MTLRRAVSFLVLVLVWITLPSRGPAISPLTDDELEQTDPSGFQLTSGEEAIPGKSDLSRIPVLVIEDVAGGPNHISSEVVISIEGSDGEPKGQTNAIHQRVPVGQGDSELEALDRSNVEGIIRTAESDLVALVVNNVHGNNQVDTRINLLINLQQPVLDLPGLQMLWSGPNEGGGGTAALNNSLIPTDRIASTPLGSPAPRLAPSQPTLHDAISVLQGLQPQAPDIQTEINELQSLTQQPGFQ